jgi:uncharacterized protein (TIGR02001 family)
MEKIAMKKTLISAAIASALMVTSAAALADVSANVGVTTDYVFRGITQSHHGAALQGGVDYTNASGFYAGIWGSNIYWVKGWLGKGSVEVDVYGGFRGAFADDFSYDVGVITYNYPGKGAANAGLADPNTTEVYGSVGYKWISAKYSYTTSDYFVGWRTLAGGKTRGSDYLELNAAYDLGDGWTAIGHIGDQTVKSHKPASYTDYKVGVSKDIGVGVVTLAYSDTDVDSNGNAGWYIWGNNTDLVAGVPTTNMKNVAKGAFALTFSKTF